MALSVLPLGSGGCEGGPKNQHFLGFEVLNQSHLKLNQPRPGLFDTLVHCKRAPTQVKGSVCSTAERKKERKEGGGGAQSSNSGIFSILPLVCSSPCSFTPSLADADSISMQVRSMCCHAHRLSIQELPCNRLCEALICPGARTVNILSKYHNCEF